MEGTAAGTPVERRIAALEAAARDTLSPETVAYVSGGSGNELTLAEATAAWRDLRLRPRTLPLAAPPPGGSPTSLALLGEALPSPIGLAPVGYQRLLHPDGERATAAGSGDHLLVTSARGDCPIEEVAAAKGAGRVWWHQHYATRQQEVGDRLARRAVEAGARALVLTVDTPYVAVKARQGRLRAVDPVAEQRPVVAADIARLAALTGVPVLVKGVLRGDDARRAVDAGAAGIVVSTHGGRQLDRSVSTAVALPEVVAAVGPGVPVLVDGGVRSGLDVLVALALGAAAVLVGRPVMWALAAGGAEWVRDLLTAWDAELGHVLGLAGCTGAEDVGPDLVRPIPPHGPSGDGGQLRPLGGPA